MISCHANICLETMLTCNITCIMKRLAGVHTIFTTLLSSPHIFQIMGLFFLNISILSFSHYSQLAGILSFEVHCMHEKLIKIYSGPY